MGKILSFPVVQNGCRDCNGCWWTDECPFYQDVAPYSMLCCEKEGVMDSEESTLEGEA